MKFRIIDRKDQEIKKNYAIFTIVHNLPKYEECASTNAHYNLYTNQQSKYLKRSGRVL